MKRPHLLFALFALLLLGGTYYLYRNQDQQLISRQVDQLIENIEHKKISLRKPSDVEFAVKAVLSDKIECYGAFPVPSGTHTTAEVIEKISEFHAWTSLCEMDESNRKIEVNGDRAKVTLEAEVHVALGKNIQRRENWTLMFELQKMDVWRITGIKGIPPGNASSPEEASDLL